MKEPTHAYWASQGLVREPGSLGCDLADAWEVAAAARLVEVLGLDDARLAQTQVRDRVRGLEEVGAIQDVVWDMQLQTAVLMSDESELAGLIRNTRPHRVIPMAAMLNEVTSAYRRAVTARWARAGLRQKQERPQIG